MGPRACALLDRRLQPHSEQGQVSDRRGGGWGGGSCVSSGKVRWLGNPRSIADSVHSREFVMTC